MRRPLASMIAAAISITALSLGLSSAASAAPASVTASRSALAPAGRIYSQYTVVPNCQGKAQVRPGSYILACADANDYLAKLSWTSWTPGLASATGVQQENNCTPDCASGHFRGYPVDVIFWGSAAVHPGEVRYTKVTLLYPGARPPYAGHQGPATVTLPLAP